MAEMRHKVIEWRRERKQLAEQAGQLLRDAGDDALSTEAEERFDAIHSDIGKLDGRIDRAERQIVAQERLSQPQGAKVGLRSWDTPDDREPDRNDSTSREHSPWPENRSHEDEVSFRFICGGDTFLEVPDDAEAFALRSAEGSEMYNEMVREVRSINSAAADQGGYLIAPRYTGQLLKGMESFGGLRDSRARDWRTGHGASINLATNNDTQMAHVVGFGQETPEEDLEFGLLTSNTLLGSSGVVLVDIDVLQDATETSNLQADLWDIAGRRIERRIQFEATTNDPAVSGRGNPGLLVAAAKGEDAALVNAVAFDELYNLKHSVNRFHRKNGEWGFADSTELALKKMKNSQGDPAWDPGAVKLGAPRTFDGDPYHVNDYMPAIGADAKSISYGDMSRLRLRMVRRVTLFRFNEKYMTKHQVGFMAFVRFGHLLEDPGDMPIKYLQHPAA